MHSRLLPLLILFTGCGHYLDERSSSTLRIPSSLDDCQELLDDYYKMNSNYPSDGEAGSDDYYLITDNWQYLSTSDRDVYTWQPAAYPSYLQWYNPYQVVYNTNLVLETLGKISLATADSSQYQQLKGAALFFRAYAFYELAQVFSPPYDQMGDNNGPGIPLRLSPDLDVASARASVADTYRQVLEDLKQATVLLPVESTIVSRPTRAAALAELARVQLTMGAYTDALSAAGLALDLHNALLDYNSLDSNAALPFPRFNDEVIFQSVSYPGGQLSSYIACADSDLVASYAADDLRRPLFFVQNYDGSYSFKGSYDGSADGALFTGLATDELYLIKAECGARLGHPQQALKDLQTLMDQRWKGGTYPLPDIEDALPMILQERRKELIFRGARWADLRRLNQDPRFAHTLYRQVNGTTYSLPANDLRYTLLLPIEVIHTSQLAQNER